MSRLSGNTVGTPARIGAGFIALVCLGILGMATYLKPAPAGHGTHQQLGLPPCGWIVAFGKPCPTCGMTTAFSNAAQLRPIEALRAQPAGAAAALFVAAGFWAAVHVAMFGSRVGYLLASALRPQVLWTALSVLVAGWLYKIVTWN